LGGLEINNIWKKNMVGKYSTRDKEKHCG